LNVKQDSAERKTKTKKNIIIISSF